MNWSLPLKKLPYIALWVMLILLAASNVLLIRQNLQMRSQLEKFQPKVLQPGEEVQPFSAQGLNGESITINYTGEETKRVLLYFTPSCPYCHEQFSYWKELLNRVNRNRFQVLGLVSESEDKKKVNEYPSSVGCESMRVALVPKGVLNSYKLSMTPTTIVVENTGKVEKAWAGKWNSEIAASASSIFGFSFSSQ